ncbi:MAG: Ig-like domain-containing protein [Pseudomonadota bacterium]
MIGFMAALGLTPATAAAPGPVACAGVRPPITPLGSQHLASLANYDAIAPSAGAVTAIQSGAWSDLATWGGLKPGGRVFIPSGISVVFDVPASRYIRSLRIEGCFELSDKVSSRLYAETVYVAPGGEFLAGAPTSPLPPSVIAEIVFPSFGPLDPVVDRTLVGKGIIAASRVRLYGSLKTPRVKVAATPVKGDQTIILSQAPSGWRIGDRVILTGTRFMAQTTNGETVIASPTQDEIRYISSISGASVTLNAPLAYSHAAPDPSVGAYLVNYSRNIRMATQKADKLPVSQRGHSMFMSTETTIEGVEFFDMGRTNKSIRAVDAAKLTTVTSTSNVKGRYPLHLHLSGFSTDRGAPVIRDVAVWGSPGWGIAQHNGKAFLFQNNTFDTFGAGFVAESGNEVGAWVENTAIKAVGVNHIVKDGGDVTSFDLGRTGDGFWLQSRSVRLHRNLAVGMTGGMGFVYFHRASDLGSRFPLAPSFVDKTLCMPAAMRFVNQPINSPGIAQFTDNEVIASEVGFHITKPSPAEPHDIRSVIDNFTAWEVQSGVDITYTSRYTVKGGLLIGAPSATDTTGVFFGHNTYDLAVVGTKISRFDYGVDLSKTQSQTFTSDFRYTVAGAVFSQIWKNKYHFPNGADQLLANIPPASPARLDFNWGAGPVIPGNALYTYIRGVKTDSSGSAPYPVATDEFLMKWTNYQEMTAQRGWYTYKTSSQKAMVVPEFYSDRLTGEVFQTSFIVTPHTFFPWPTTLRNGSPAYQGKLTAIQTPPTASNDFVQTSANSMVVISATANDTTNDGVLLPSGYTHARNGNVYQRLNGAFEYTPFPDFRGTDQFTYWVRNRQGIVSRATVSVTVN